MLARLPTRCYILNGKPGPCRFKPSLGLRQGDHVSLFLFLFVNDVLSEMMNKACHANLLSPVRIGQLQLPISHIFFADDSLFFLDATLDNCLHLSDILDTFCSASGQLINVNKSSIYFSPNTSHHVAHLLSSVLQMQVVLDPGKYLGLPTI